MSRCKIIRIFLVGITGTLLSPTAVWAQSCPPGYFVIGGPGSYGCAPIYNGGSTPPPRIDEGVPTISLPDARDIPAMLEGIVEKDIERVFQRRQGESEKDHLFRTTGRWDFEQPPTVNNSQRRCLATYLRPPALVNHKIVHGIVKLIAPVSPADPALLVFYGIDIPVPDKEGMKSVQLIQNDDPAQTISAYHIRSSSKQGIGGFVFVVPNTAALLGAITDSYAAKIRFRGEQVLSVDWHGGDTAGQFLRKCVGQAG